MDRLENNTKPFMIVINKNKTSYWFYSVNNSRAINPKAKRNAQEVIIHGKPANATIKDLKKLNIDINNLQIPCTLKSISYNETK